MDARTTTTADRAEDRESILAEARAWARRLRVDHPTTEDAAKFRRWRAQSAAHAHAWAQTASDWRDIGPIAQAYRAQHAGSAVQTAIARPARRLFLGSALTATGAAAVAAVAYPPLGLWPSWSEWSADYRTATGEQREIELAGRVDLVLNTQTSLSVLDKSDKSVTRVELLSGEAAVRNRGGDILEVAADAGRIRLGTGSIEVRRLTDHIRVVCTEGEAELRHPSRTVVLQARQQVVYRRDAAELATLADTAQASAWREGMVVFHNTPLPEAVAEINRYRPGRVVLMGDRLKGRRISGRFRIGALDEALAQIQQLFSTGIRVIGGVVLLA
ncbi:FecR family protein [Variovorax boronicumulans]